MIRGNHGCHRWYFRQSKKAFFGTAFSQYAWLPVLRVLGAQVWSGKLMWVSGAMGKFDEKRIEILKRGLQLEPLFLVVGLI